MSNQKPGKYIVSRRKRSANFSSNGNKLVPAHVKCCMSPCSPDVLERQGRVIKNQTNTKTNISHAILERQKRSTQNISTSFVAMPLYCPSMCH